MTKKKSWKQKAENPLSTYWLKKCDRLFGKIFHSQRQVDCVIGIGCGGKSEMSHLIGRYNYLYRWDLENVIPLCSYHHRYSREMSAHFQPAKFYLWLQENMPKTWEFVELNRQSIIRKAELPFTFQEKYYELEKIAKELNIK